ncbi:GAF domain-containing sensor histidine kinase [Longimicrobium sp.]|uniref:GAF domain-containing sensor histidine kinase n=1 Tax=Longimicrobium sp. TaxID=2029185 RepID=UPI002BA7433F|nr:ATP-binding protein [Longimicrobium sp.]HSU13584.1 ATP-binding protein [Longimicrobium sp.]
MSTDLSPAAALDGCAFLAEASRRLAESVDYEQTLKTVAALALPRLGDWSIVDLAEPDGSMRRLAVVHPDPDKQALARRLEVDWPPERDDPLGVPVVVRTRATTSTDPVTDDFLAGAARDPGHLETLRRLGIASAITVPLLAREQVLGAITFVGSRPGRGHTEQDRALAEDLAGRCALSIAHMRMVEELKKSVLLRDQVLGYVTHDLKNPLGAIVLVASQILAEARTPREQFTRQEQIGAAERILAATVHMQRLIGDLLEVAQIGAGGVSIHPRPVRPAAVVEDVLYTYAPGLAARSLRLEAAVTGELPLLRADPGRLRQVFENLLENAAKFTPEGGVITLGAARFDGSVLFSVADTGAGVPRDQMPRLFDRFWQARWPGVGSAGLGLTICKGIVEAHGGAIWAESAVGRGSTFYFRIPVQ